MLQSKAVKNARLIGATLILVTLFGLAVCGVAEMAVASPPDWLNKSPVADFTPAPTRVLFYEGRVPGGFPGGQLVATVDVDGSVEVAPGYVCEDALRVVGNIPVRRAGEGDFKDSYGRVCQRELAVCREDVSTAGLFAIFICTCPLQQ